MFHSPAAAKIGAARLADVAKAGLRMMILVLRFDEILEGLAGGLDQKHDASEKDLGNYFGLAGGSLVLYRRNSSFVAVSSAMPKMLCLEEYHLQTAV